MLLRDILSGNSEDVLAGAGIIADVKPDVLLLIGFDHDAQGAAMAAYADLLADLGAPYPHRLSPTPNTGIPTQRDIDGDGRFGRPRDAQGYGRFRGAGGMALLSRYPTELFEDFTALPWDSLPGSLSGTDGADGRQRLSSVGHWVAALELPGRQTIHLGAFHATPPVFDGPDDRNGRRNHDEIRFWQAYLDGEIGHKDPRAPFILLGDANLDPEDGEGRRKAIADLLAYPMLQDPQPQSAGGRAEADPGQIGDPALDTVDWRNGAPGNLRVSYLLPGRRWEVVASGVHWPLGRSTEMNLASRHRMVWADLVLRGAE